MSTPQRYPSGVSTRSSVHPMGNLPFPDPTRFYIWEDEFDDVDKVGNYIAGSTNTGTTLYIVDDADTARSGSFGIGEFIVDNADGDNYHYQWGDGTNEVPIWVPDSTKKVWMYAKFKIEDADQDLPFVGFYNVNSDPWNAEPTDGFIIRSPSATTPDGTLEIAVQKAAATDTTSSSFTIEDDTWMEVWMYYDGSNIFSAWYSSGGGTVTQIMKEVDVSSVFPDIAVGLVPSFGMEAADTGTDIFSIDRLLFICER